MKESLFKKNTDKIRAGARFAKNNAPVSKFSKDYDEDKLLSYITGELGSLFSGLKAGGLSKEELEISLSPHGERFSVCIKNRSGKQLGFNEVNLIFRLATELGLSPRTVDGGVEILSSLPMLEDASIYARALTLLREQIDN